MMSLAASKYSVESWPVTSRRKQKEKRREGDAVACEMQRVEFHRTVFMFTTVNRISLMINYISNKMISIVTNLH